MVEHPSKFIAESHANILRAEAFDAEQKRQLSKTQLDIIHKQGWLNMYVPGNLGGLELSLPEILRIEESLAWVDGSVGWFVTLCSGAAWFIGFLEKSLAEEIFATDDICIAGSGAIAGTANKTENGYKIDGFWKYATGAPHATVFTVNCQLKVDGVPRIHEDGTAEIGSFLLNKEEVFVHNTWNSMGMISTGTHAIEVRNTTIPFNRLFTIHPSHTKMDHTIFRYPFLQLAETTLAVNLSGMCIRFIDLCSSLFSSNDHVRRQKRCDCSQVLDAARKQFYVATDAAWQELVKTGDINKAVLYETSALSCDLVETSRRVINELYPYCGLSATDTRTEINRVWRNFNTAGQHSLFKRRSGGS